MKSTLAMAALALSAMTQTTQAQDVAAGEQSFKKCTACHAIGEGATNKVGPELNSLEGRHSGTRAGYSYSDANKNSGLTWDEATFRDYIKDPRAKIPGTKMIYPGLKDEQKTSDLLAYLKQFDADGKKKKNAPANRVSNQVRLFAIANRTSSADERTPSFWRMSDDVLAIVL